MSSFLKGRHHEEALRLKIVTIVSPFARFWSFSDLIWSQLLTSALLWTAARIKRSRKTNQTKFKVRCHRFLYTLVLKDADKADKLKQSLPPGAFISFTDLLSVIGLDWISSGILRIESRKGILANGFVWNSAQDCRCLQGWCQEEVYLNYLSNNGWLVDGLDWRSKANDKWLTRSRTWYDDRLIENISTTTTRQNGKEN